MAADSPSIKAPDIARTASKVSQSPSPTPIDTRAVIFSAMTNAVAFGSMWASDYPGISSMGRMMALALLCTMTAAVLFQPVLMGKPRRIKTNSPPAP
jgi:hypothetical protein